MPSKNLKIHFIGIGGIGVSALAQYYLKKRNQISGSDLTSSEIIDFLKKKGVKIFTPHHPAKAGATGQIGHSEKNLPKDTNLVIYSAAVCKNNPELEKAKKLGIKCLTYSQALGELTKKYFTIAVSGTHGKSTTTAMIALILIKAGLNPTVILGTKLKEFGNSNFRIGESKYLIIEADEWNASFLNYWPKIIVLTNIEREHLDYYKNLKNILKTYKEYIGHLPKSEVLVANEEDKNIQKIIRDRISEGDPISLYRSKQEETSRLKKILKIPGKHNVSNALAALTVARVLKIPNKISFKALSEYRGSWRRFEESNCSIKTNKLKTINYKLISDYGHHPTEIKATLEAAREKYPKKEIICIFQPHQYQRTFYLFDDFVKVFKKVPIDKLIITDIYDVAGRETKGLKNKVNSKKIVEAVGKSSVIYLPKEKIIDYIKKNLRGKEVVIIMGAGDIYNLNLNLNSKFKIQS